MCQATGIKQYVSVKKWLRNKGPFSYFLPIYTSIALLPQCLSCLFRIHLIALSKLTDVDSCKIQFYPGQNCNTVGMT